MQMQMLLRLRSVGWRVCDFAILARCGDFHGKGSSIAVFVLNQHAMACGAGHATYVVQVYLTWSRAI